uniref:Ribosomal protein S4 n=1 Tax=Lithodesmium undulatum TaxID=59812 RepID=A0A7T7A9U9_LITUN|nr:ribosomal protein S4 [Lithodesmium undulatum]QQJ94647.1 ribosomal protein S4 [Lithodesmium undulatum]
MVIKKTTRPFLRYKKILKLKQNVQNKSKLIKFKSKKWQNLVLRSKKFFQYSYKIKYIDQLNYFIPKFTDFFSNKFQSNLYAKQRFVYVYGYLKRKYLKKTINKIVSRNKVNYFLIKKLESRLDSVLCRSHFVNSFRTARQLISHGHVSVNNKIVKKNSFILKEGDIVSVSKHIHNLIESNVLNSRLIPITPKYLQVNYKIFYIFFSGNLNETNLSNQYHFWLNSKTLIDFYKNN